MNCTNPYKCPIDATLSLIGGKYIALILWKLREMERDGLVNRVVYPVVPPKTEYSLTEFGKSIIPILDAMNSWGRTYLSSQKQN